MKITIKQVKYVALTVLAPTTMCAGLLLGMLGFAYSFAAIIPVQDNGKLKTDPISSQKTTGALIVAAYIGVEIFSKFLNISRSIQFKADEFAEPVVLSQQEIDTIKLQVTGKLPNSGDI
jgi:hypothetical protein